MICTESPGFGFVVGLFWFFFPLKKKFSFQQSLFLVIFPNFIYMSEGQECHHGVMEKHEGRKSSYKTCLDLF